MAETHRHHWKIWLTLVLVVGILGLFLYTDTGKKTLNLFKLGQFTKTTATPTGAQFSISLNSNIDAFYSQLYKVTNSSFAANGICRQSIKLNELVLQKEATRCDAILSGFSGTFDYTKAGSIVLSGESSVIFIDDSTYSSSKPIQVELEVIPFKFTLEGLSQQKISLPSVSGDVDRLKEDGSVKAVVYLANNSLEISNFLGSLKLENGTAILNGMANSVKGTDFSW
ncbi:hypothetical protein HZB88_02315 [archaeon]|nr:hypothetical protein [archaeon]